MFQHPIVHTVQLISCHVTVDRNIKCTQCSIPQQIIPAGSCEITGCEHPVSTNTVRSHITLRHVYWTDIWWPQKKQASKTVFRRKLILPFPSWGWRREFSQKNQYNCITIQKVTVEQWLRCCATNRKVAGSIPDGVTGIFYWHNPSVRTMAVGSTQPLIEINTRSISWSNSGRRVKLTTLPPSWTIVT